MRRPLVTATPNRGFVALGRYPHRMIAAASEMHARFVDIALPFGAGFDDFMETA